MTGFHGRKPCEFHLKGRPSSFFGKVSVQPRQISACNYLNRIIRLTHLQQGTFIHNFSHKAGVFSIIIVLLFFKYVPTFEKVIASRETIGAVSSSKEFI